MDNLLTDLRYAWRWLLRNPLLSIVAVLTLGLGIGANTAIFSFGSALLLRPFPFPDLERLVVLWEHHPQQGRQANARGTAGDRNPLSNADFIDLRQGSRVFDLLAAYRYAPLNLSLSGEPERVQAAAVTSGFFEALGARAELGRTFTLAEEQPGSANVVLLSHTLWQQRFAGDRALLGRRLPLDGRDHTVVGVLPASFDFPLGGVRLWVPLVLAPDERAERGKLGLLTVARLLPGTSLKRAQASLDIDMAGLAQRFPTTNTGRGLTLIPLRELQAGFTAPFVLVFQCAAAFVLLIACVNLANLLLARATGRQREIALRTALGASRWRLVRQLLTESLLLALLGALFALWLASVGLGLMRNSLPEDILKWVAGWRSIQLDQAAFAFTLGAALFTSLLVGLLPAWLSSRPDLTGTLKEGGRGTSAGRGGQRLRSVLVISEIALALVLLAGAGLMIKGFTGLTEIYASLSPERVVTLRTSLPEWRYTRPEQFADYYERALVKLSALPQVDAVGLVSHLPADLGPVPASAFSVAGRQTPNPHELPSADLQTINPGYFRTLNVPMQAGRALEVQDVAASAPVVVISASLAQRFFPGEEAVGQQLKLGAPSGQEPWRRVVGVVADIKQYWFDRQPRATIYVSHAQAPRRQQIFLLRSTGSPETLVAAARAELLTVDPQLPVDEVRTLATVVRESTALLRVAAGLLMVLGGVALALASVGVYGLMSYSVSQRTHELGIRAALGASRAELLRLVVGQSARLAALGVLLGVPLVLGLSRALGSLMFGVVRLDWGSLALVVIGLVGITLLAGYLPARRASEVDPVAALHCE